MKSLGPFGVGVAAIFVAGAIATEIVVDWDRFFPVGREARVNTDLVAIATAVERFASEHGGKLPSSIDQAIDDERRESESRGQFRCDAGAPLDPWDHEYVLRPHPNGSFEVGTLGSDGAVGGDGDAADTFLPTRANPNAEVTHR